MRLVFLLLHLGMAIFALTAGEPGIALLFVCAGLLRHWATRPAQVQRG